MPCPPAGHLDISIMVPKDVTYNGHAALPRNHHASDWCCRYGHRYPSGKSWCCPGVFGESRIIYCVYSLGSSNSVNIRVRSIGTNPVSEEHSEIG